MANIEEKQAMLKNAMSKAKKLIQLESNGTLDKIAKGARDGISESLDGSVSTQDLLTTAPKNVQQIPFDTQKVGSAAMHVPAAIRESFAKSSISDGDMFKAFNGENNSDLSFLSENVDRKQNTQNVKEIIREGLNSTVSQQQIDYPMIRTIVEDIVRKYASSLSKKLMTEGKNNTLNALMIGKTFKFVDNSGNIYECNMKKLGNINDKKRNVNG